MKLEEKRVYGVAAAGAGDLGAVPSGDVLGACPSCGAELRVCAAVDPRSGQTGRALLHPVPFCSYFGETDAGEIESAIARRS